MVLCQGQRTQKDPFDGEWEQVMSWLVANPELSSGDIFRELQRLSLVGQLAMA